MFRRLKYSRLAFIFTTLYGCAIIVAGILDQNCKMKPARIIIQLPSQGIIWLADEESAGQCDSVPTVKWKNYSSPEFDILIYADGPSGSGRYWTVTVAMKSKQERKRRRDFCFTTSTVGWRTIPESAKLSISWIEDLDSDGKPELIIWDSFPLHEEATTAEYGLVGWVYQIDQNGIFRIDWKLSRKLAGDIASIYQQPSQDDDPISRNLRLAAAEALQSFATNQCKPPNP